MKKYIITRAHTQSEWDSVRFALIELRASLVERIKKMQSVILKWKEEDPILGRASSIEFISDEAEYFVDDDELPREMSNFIEEYGKFFLMAELSDDEVGKLTKPEQDIRYGRVRVSDSSVTFEAEGKHTGELYWCSFNIDELP